MSGGGNPAAASGGGNLKLRSEWRQQPRRVMAR